MASVASLLFKIGAEPDGAVENIATLRKLMGTSLGEMKEEFADWSNEVFGSMSTVNGALMAGGATVAALGAATVAFAADAEAKYEEYAGAVDHAMRVTGQSAETMSVLHFAAGETRTSFDSMVTGITRFEGSISKAADGNQVLAGSFAKLGISQGDLKAGEQDLMPLLGKVMDGFAGMKSAVDKTALARDLFSRGGAEMLAFLNQGSAGLKEFQDKAEQLGVVLTNKDIVAFREMKATEEQLKAQHEALDVVIGKSTIGFKQWGETAFAAIIKAFSATDWHGSNALDAYLGNVVKQYHAITAEVKKMTEAAENAPPPPIVDPPKIAAALEDYRGISDVLDSIRQKVAALGSPGEQMQADMAAFAEKVGLAQKKLQDLEAQGKISVETANREAAELNEIPGLLAKAWQEYFDKLNVDNRKANDQKFDDDQKALQDLKDKVAAATEDGVEGQRAALERQIRDYSDALLKKGQLDRDAQDLLQQLYAAGLKKIDTQEAALATAEDDRRKQAVTKATDEYLKLLDKVDQYQLRVVESNQTTAERLETVYEQDLAKYSEVAAAKAAADLLAVGRTVEAGVVYQRYADVRTAIDTKYKQDLQALINSQGWQGMFGNAFAQGLKNNEKLLKEWSTSTQQSHMLVKVSLADLKQMALDTFGAFAQAEGQAAASAIVNSESIGKAMKAALAATLESVAGQAFTQAIYATGWGFFDLAQQDYEGAANAFTAAGIFAAVGGAAAVAGRALTPKDSSASASSGASASGGGASDTSAAPGASDGTATGQQQGPYVQLNVYGHVIGKSGASELLDILNGEVVGNDGKLVASHNAQGTKL